MQSLTLFTLVRAFHILAGAAWVGGVFFIGRFLLPGIQAIGPAGGQLMQHLAQVRRLPAYMMGVAILTVLTGLFLYWHDTAASAGVWPRTPSGMMFGVGGLLGIVTVVFGLTISSPAAKRMGALAGSLKAAGRAPTPEETAELSRLQAKLTLGSRITTVLVFLATVAMGMARYIQ